MRSLLRLAGSSLLLVFAAACATPPDATGPTGGPQASGADIIPGRYIVVFKPGAPSGAALMAEATGGGMEGVKTDFVYRSALSGFAGELSDAAVARLRADPRVDFVEPDRRVYASTTQTSAPWGLDRIDAAAGLSTTYDYTSGGAGVTVYIIDTGLRYDHAQFGGRARFGFDAVSATGGGADCNGHGTHVGGTVGGSTYGVAKAVQLVAVRVLDCNGSGSTSGVIAGVDWVRLNAVKPAVANMSLGGGASTALDNAVNGAITSGVTFAIAAGNGNFLGIPVSACGQSPARVAAALTVGATDSQDREASFSNYGTCVDVLAPGVGIISSWYTSSTATSTISGTSMATPHVAGVAARILEGTPTATPATVASTITSTATLNAISLHSRSRRNGTPNRFLFRHPAL